MTVEFRLKSKTNRKGLAAVDAIIRYKNMRINRGVGLLIEPKHFNNKEQKARETKAFPQFPQFNQELRAFQNAAEQAYLHLRNELGTDCPTLEDFNRELNKRLNKNSSKEAKEKPLTFLQWLEQIIADSESGIRLKPKDGKRYSVNTIKTYRTLQKHLNGFQKETGYKIDFDTINLDFHKKFSTFCQRTSEHLNKANGLQPNSFGKDIQIIKLVMNEANERGVSDCTGHKSKYFVIPRTDPDTIYLTEDEIDVIAATDLTGKRANLSAIRDLFIIGCWTGLRFGDWQHIKRSEIDDNYITKKQQKGGKTISIKYDDLVRTVLERYNYDLPKAPSNQKTNESLKEICKDIPCLQAEVEHREYEGGKEVTRYYPKWKLISTHTARRSFATNEVKAGTPIRRIMAVTGHKTEKSFWRYVRLTPTEDAALLHENRQERLAKRRAANSR